MPEYSHKMFFFAFVYLISLLIGSSFIFRAASLSALPEFWLFAAIIFLPLVFLTIYHYHARFPALWPYKNLLHAIAVILMMVSIIFVAIVIAPIVLLL